MVCGNSDRYVQDGSGFSPRIVSEPFLVCFGDGEVDWQDKAGATLTMLFADYMSCSKTREQVEETLESWSYALERREMKVSSRKTEYQ